ncbi:Vomeronasal type-1 receptor 90 [Galemys pyrenaicus]|uniref:Vomeronasal type-1 receptor 90 n=1 Tax=Galemys pyrenaicus TaxID=202257 RepID=A0A8J6DFJ9_GALPY|nr:Vomeronasal type-1 receptor 90 [Galemys pyrenaicus]KAG8507293.1 Vomeronasal type-1 receptor 90 [Galemys pyrenaicus]
MKQMTWRTFLQGLLFLCFIGHGIVGNVLILGGHLRTFILGPGRNPIDLILMHLAFVNITIICTKGSRDLSTIFQLGNVLGDAGCKIVIYLGRVARGLSICTTCLLSVVQAITISPRTTSWRKLKPRSAWQVLPYLLLSWVFNFLISSNLLLYITAVHSTNSSALRPYIGYCEMLPAEQIMKWLFLSLMTLRDVVFQSLMGWSSGYVAFRLIQHHKCVLYIQSSRLQGNPSPEMRATQSVLMLMTCFLFFYWADFIFSFYLGSIFPNNYIVYGINIFLTFGYASLSPFVLMLRDVRGTIFLLVTGPGIVGNVFVLVNHVCIFLGGTKKKSIHLILMHLAFTNTIILFCKIIPKAAAVFQLRDFLGDPGCQLVVYLEWVARGLSICTSSLLTVVQAITMSPRGSCGQDSSQGLPGTFFPCSPSYGYSIPS